MQNAAALQFFAQMPHMHITSLSIPSEVFELMFKNVIHLV